MEVSKRKIALIISLIVLCCSCGFIVGYYARRTTKHWKYGPTANLFFTFETFEGEAEIQTHNVITNIGENHTRVMHSQNGTWVALNWISIGNATASASLTQLTTQYDRKLGTIGEWTNAGDYAFNCTYKWTFVETVTLNCAGGHWAGSGDKNMYAVANFPDGAQKFNTNENLTVRWTYTFNCN